jgi:hypothetical protein
MKGRKDLRTIADPRRRRDCSRWILTLNVGERLSTPTRTSGLTAMLRVTKDTSWVGAPAFRPPAALGANRQIVKTSSLCTLFGDTSLTGTTSARLTAIYTAKPPGCEHDAYCSFHHHDIAIKHLTARQCQMAESARRLIVSGEAASS